MDLHGYTPCDPNEGSQNPPSSATTSAEDHTGVRTTNQSVYYPTMQHNLPHMSRQMTQYDLFPNFNPGSLAFNHFMYNLNQGQGHFPYESQMSPMSWGAGLPSNLGHMDERGSKYIGNGSSADFEAESDQMNRISNYQTSSPLPHTDTVSSPNVNSFVYPISAFSSNGRSLQKRPRKHSMDNSDNSEFPGTDILPSTTHLPSFPSAYIQEMNTRPCGSGLGYFNQTRNSSNHSTGTPDRQIATGDNLIDPGHGHASCIESKLDTSVNLAKDIKGIYHQSEKDGLISDTDSDGGLSGEDSDQDIDSRSLTFKVEMDSIASSDEEVENSESDESSHTDPYSTLEDASQQASAVQATVSNEGRGRKRLWKKDSLCLSSCSSVGERPSQKVTKHHVKLDRGGNEVVQEPLPIKLTSEARATQGIDVPTMEKNLSKNKKKPGKTKTGPAVKKQKQDGSDVPVVTFVDKYFYCGHCSCEFRNCETFLRHYVAYHDDFFPKLLRKVYTLHMVNCDIEEAMTLLLECKICETFFATEEERTMHLNSTHKDVKWQCLRCGLEFGVLHEWNDHLLNHRPDQKYKCLSCSEEFDSVRMATEHYKESHDYVEEKPVYGEGRRDNETLIKLLNWDDYGQKCPHCNRYFDMWNWTDAYGHKRKFLADDPRPFKCVWCPKTYLHNEPLIRHIRDHPPFACPHCDNVKFDLKSDLQLHLMTHLGQQNYIVYNCKICGKTFSQGLDYEKHMNCHYGKTYPCEHCERAFITRRELKLHLFNHSGTKPFICDTCGKQFKEKRPLLEHIRIHTGERPFQCEFCSADFPTRSQLRQHRKHNHEERKFKCDKCDWKFPNAYLLNRHYKKHTGNTGFRCDVCFKDLYDKVQLEWHMNTHTGIKPFKCRFCDRAFCAGKSQYIHERTIHKEQVLAEKFNSR